jgi:hypothetical protein
VLWLAGIVLFIVAPTIVLGLIQGAVTIAHDLILIVAFVCRSLWRLYRYLRPRKQPSPAAPSRTSVTSTTRATRKTDPQLASIRNMAAGWKATGDPVGAINLRTGEVFAPAPTDQNEGR